MNTTEIPGGTAARGGIAPRAGVYRVTCRRTGRSYVGVSRHLVGTHDELERALTAGTHPNAALQADWDLDGGRSFEFVTLDELPPGDDAATDRDLARLRDLWMDQLGLDEGHSY